MKKLLHRLHTLVLTMSFFTSTAFAFSDTEDHWAEAYIEELSEQEVVSGYESSMFGPDNFLSRAEMAKIAVLAFELEHEDGNEFSDVDAKQWYAEYVNTAASHGIITGYENENGERTGLFGPANFVTRAEAVKILVEAAELEIEDDDSHFEDVVRNDWYFKYIETAYENEIIDGYENGEFGPSDFVTRAQISKMTVLSQNAMDTEEFVEEPEEELDFADQEVSALNPDNPFAGKTFYVDASSDAYDQIEEWKQSDPKAAEDLLQIASQPMAKWFGDWYDDIESAVNSYVTKVGGNLPITVIYNIPGRDCGNYSAGGSVNDEIYLDWIRDFANGVGDRDAVVILEPDALALDCLYQSSVDLIAEAVEILKSKPGISVYIDSGHTNWVPSDEMAERLKNANIASADGFALNVSNFYTAEENEEYGEEISALVGDKHFIIDTSRSGNGSNGEWCNPEGRKIGAAPTTNTGNSLVDAYFWIKPPGESDGNCNGGPSAGTWWTDYALGLVRN